MNYPFATWISNAMKAISSTHPRNNRCNLPIKFDVTQWQFQVIKISASYKQTIKSSSSLHRLITLHHVIEQFSARKMFRLKFFFHLIANCSINLFTFAICRHIVYNFHYISLDSERRSTKTLIAYNTSYRGWWLSSSCQVMAIMLRHMPWV